MKSRYMNRDLGDETRLGIIVVKHPVMDLKLPALQFKFGDKTLMCFLADSEGNSIDCTFCESFCPGLIVYILFGSLLDRPCNSFVNRPLYCDSY